MEAIGFSVASAGRRKDEDDRNAAPSQDRFDSRNQRTASPFHKVNPLETSGRIMLPNPDELLELRRRLRFVRIYLASLKSIELTDVDSLVHVAEAELDRLTLVREYQARL